MRRLVKLVDINEIVPIDGADMIELAKIDGWQCVVKKGQFEAGQTALYFEYDSLLPLDDERFSFLAGRNEYEVDGKRYARIKTMKLRKTLSQGLLLPRSDFTQEMDNWTMAWLDDNSANLADYIGVLKYEPTIPAQLAGSVKGSFPSFIRKTDQERVNNVTREYYEAVNNKELFELSVKLDGSSITCFCYAPEQRTGVCSRNLELKTDDSNADNTFVKMFKQHFELPLTQFMTETGRSIAIQGEMVGPGIQGNFEGLDKTEVYIYDVFDIDHQLYLSPQERYDLLNDMENMLDCRFNHVPLLDVQTLLPATVEQCIEQADGKSGLKGKYREGVVYKSLTRDFTFKAIGVNYLLKEK